MRACRSSVPRRQVSVSVLPRRTRVGLGAGVFAALRGTFFGAPLSDFAAAATFAAVAGFTAFAAFFGAGFSAAHVGIANAITTAQDSAHRMIIPMPTRVMNRGHHKTAR